MSIDGKRGFKVLEARKRKKEKKYLPFGNEKVLI
jgi:hypothetical protein